MAGVDPCSVLNMNETGSTIEPSRHLRSVVSFRDSTRNYAACFV